VTDDVPNRSDPSDVASDDDEVEEEVEEDELADDYDSEDVSDEDDSRGSDDEYSGVESEDSLDASFADDSYIPDSEGSEYDQLEGEPSSPSEKDEDGQEDDVQSVDLEWEEAQEMAGMAIRSHTRVLKSAAIEGWYISKDKTVLGVVEVVRSLVNTVGAFEVSIRHFPHMTTLLTHIIQDGPVTSDVILTHLKTYEALLLSDDREFVFNDRRDLLNKYLALVKYASGSSIDPTTVSQNLKNALADKTIRDDEGNIDLKLLVRLMKQQYLHAE
jgi:hypothetical protein